MEKPLRVLLYGRSVILGTLEVGLNRYPQLETCVLSIPFPTIQGLRAMAPDVIIFDIASPHPEAALTLLETYPGLLLIGVNVNRDEMLVLSSNPVQALSITDLLNVIHQKDSESSAETTSQALGKEGR